MSQPGIEPTPAAWQAHSGVPDILYYPTIFMVDIFILLYSTFGGAVAFRDTELYTSRLC